MTPSLARVIRQGNRLALASGTALLLGAAPFALAAEAPKAAAPAQPPQLVALKAARLIDVTSGKVVKDPVVLIEGEKIKAVGPDVVIPSDARVVDLGASTLLPGLIDSHVHLGGFGPRFGTARGALAGAKQALVTLKAGFTTLRNMGGRAFTGIALRDAINEGDIPGPRIYDAGTLLTTTGGHCSGQPTTPEDDKDGAGVANGADAFERKVRQQFKYGADFIKVCITGGFMSGTDPRVTQFSEEELKSVIDTAHRYRKKVAVHAHGADGIRLAAQLGADSIEHASLVDEEGLKLLKQKQIPVVPTLAIDSLAQEHAVEAGASAYTLAILKQTATLHKQNIAKAIKAGIPIIYGTDAPITPHGTNAVEFHYLVEAGLTPLQAIQAATLTPARWLDAADDIGSIEAGRYADIIAVKDDPLADIKVLEKVQWVMKGGVIYKD
ncbi:metal-dependent hydrolase family protein, partial [Pseudomonas tohonis]|uniref:metal-dependent hydrolase family protein n=1 Tax=Pseudomonas tohonis TaxID=2725477 RepID=UPI001F1D3D54